MNMNKDLHDIEELFKSALADNEEWPTSKVWDGVENILDKEDMVSFKKKYANIKKITFLLFFSLLGVAIYEIETQLHKSGIASVQKATGLALNATTTPETKTVPSLPNSVGKGNLRGNSFSTRNIDKSAGNKKDRGYSVGAHLTLNYLNESPTADGNSPREGNKKGDGFSNESNIGRTSKSFAAQQYPSLISAAKQTSPDAAPTVNLVDLSKKNSYSTLSISEGKMTKDVGKKKEKRRSPFSLTAFFSPDFASYRLLDNEQNFDGERAGEIEQDENHEFSYTIGVLMEYRFKKRLSIESGLTFSNTNITLNPRMIYAEAVNSGDIKYRLNTSSGYGYVLPSFSPTPTIGDSLYAITSTHILQYAGLPVSLKYNIRHEKIEFSLMAGASLNYLIKGKIETFVENGTGREPEIVGNLYGLKKIYFSSLTGIAVNYHINDKLSISLSPTFRYALNSINKNTAVKSYPNSLMFPIGLKIQL